MEKKQVSVSVVFMLILDKIKQKCYNTPSIKIKGDGILFFYAKCKYVADIYKGTVEVDKEYYVECRRENCLKIKGKFYPSNMFEIIEIKYPMEIFSNLFSDGTVYDERFIDNLQHKNYMADFIMPRRE